MALTLIIADDDEGFRESVKRYLGPTVEVVGEADRGPIAVAMVRMHRPQVVLMDIEIPGLDGIAATREIKAAVPDTKVILLTAHREEAYLSATGKTGADALLPKQEVRSDILALVTGVAAGFGVGWDGRERRALASPQGRGNRQERRRADNRGGLSR
jgi:DNA-binding NarL/FixJ family response regulator